MIFQLFFSHWDEEGVLLVYKESIEDELGVCHTLTLLAHAFMELKRSDKRDQCLE